MNYARLFRAGLVLGAVSSWILVATGCPGTLTEEEKKMFQGGTSCPDVPALLAAKCATVGCHVEGTPMDLGSPGVEARVVGTPASMSCMSLLLANPADPESSLLYTKLVTPPCGLKMPLGTTMTSNEIECVKTWIGGLDPNAGTGGGGGSGGAAGMGGSM